MKHIIFIHVADVANGFPNQLLVIKYCLGRNLTTDTNNITFNKCLASDTTVLILPKARVENGITDRVRHLVRMAFPNRFR